MMLLRYLYCLFCYLKIVIFVNVFRSECKFYSRRERERQERNIAGINVRVWLPHNRNISGQRNEQLNSLGRGVGNMFIHVCVAINSTIFLCVFIVSLSTASIMVEIKNEGVYAFQYDKYGDLMWLVI